MAAILHVDMSPIKSGGAAARRKALGCSSVTARVIYFIARPHNIECQQLAFVRKTKTPDDRPGVWSNNAREWGRRETQPTK